MTSLLGPSHPLYFSSSKICYIVIHSQGLIYAFWSRPENQVDLLFQRIAFQEYEDNDYICSSRLPKLAHSSPLQRVRLQGPSPPSLPYTCTGLPMLASQCPTQNRLQPTTDMTQESMWDYRVFSSSLFLLSQLCESRSQSPFQTLFYTLLEALFFAGLERKRLGKRQVQSLSRKYPVM